MRDCTTFYVDGQWVAPTEPRRLEVINPATESVAGVISLGSRADVDRAVLQTRAAGGSVIAGPLDLPNVGRGAVVIDPDGAEKRLGDELEDEEELARARAFVLRGLRRLLHDACDAATTATSRAACRSRATSPTSLVASGCGSSPRTAWDGRSRSPAPACSAGPCSTSSTTSMEPKRSSLPWGRRAVRSARGSVRRKASRASV